MAPVNVGYRLLSESPTVLIFLAQRRFYWLTLDCRVNPGIRLSSGYGMLNRIAKCVAYQDMALLDARRFV